MTLRFHPRRAEKDRQFRVGVIGLGAGILACYANSPALGADQNSSAPDHLSFLEINPVVIDSAERDFTFLKDARNRGTQLELLLGDARIVLERLLDQGQPRKFDVLAVDAFTCDAVPLHLLTKECFKIYFDHLNPDGILALHISNPFKLAPVIRASAREYGWNTYLIDHPGKSDGEEHSRWAIVTKNEDFIHRPEISRSLSDAPHQDKMILWTDDFHSLFQVF